ncbi:hypothetical protein PG997_010246 [Apiospora hydei]|uniref:Uncharacterized protein n=1 Tax=Apiospora hydei TaxID=1337664 RepID=A0ABR1VWG5_9PEZI
MSTISTDGTRSDPFDDFKANIFYLFAEVEGRSVVGVRALGGTDGGCDAARGAHMWERQEDISGKKRRGSRYWEPGRDPGELPRALEVHTNYVQFTLYASRGPWNIIDTWDKVNGKCVEDRSGSYDCGPISGLSMYKCVGWAPPYNLAGMN